MRVEVGTVIKRPIEEVFSFMSDPRKHAEWVQPVESDSNLSSGPVQVGTTFHEENKFLGRHLGEEWTVTVYEPPHRYEQQATIKGAPMRIGMTLTPEGDGTRVDMVTEGDPSGLAGRFFKLSEPIVARAIKNQQQTDLDTLKLILENREQVAS